jgi:hypothetical protein
MMIRRPDRIVVLGMMTKMPVPGVIWQTVHYVMGLRWLGYDVWYVEAHGRTPSPLMTHRDDDGAQRAAEFLRSVMQRFDLDRRWVFHALHADGRCWPSGSPRLDDLYDSAALILNLHGGTLPLPEHVRTGRLVLIETDPVELQLELAANRPEAVEFFDAHCACFTFGENLGRSDCGLPTSTRFPFLPTRQPVVLDFWPSRLDPGRSRFTTIGNWKQTVRRLRFQGETYGWSKHVEFLKFLDLPVRSGQSFELALSACDADDRRLLEEHGWQVADARTAAGDLDSYRDYIVESRAEFTVAKDQNIRLRSGWFSDRSATYLASGRPVITQQTGFDSILPTGGGLFSFTTLDGALAAVDAVLTDYAGHCQSAARIGREYFSHDVVLPRLLADAGL